MYRRTDSKYRSRTQYRQDAHSAGQPLPKRARVAQTPERIEMNDVSAQLGRYRMSGQPQPVELRARYDELFAICAAQVTR